MVRDRIAFFVLEIYVCVQQSARQNMENCKDHAPACLPSTLLCIIHRHGSTLLFLSSTSLVTALLSESETLVNLSVLIQQDAENSFGP